jgi:hypothetical protein
MVLLGASRCLPHKELGASAKKTTDTCNFSLGILRLFGVDSREFPATLRNRERQVYFWLD